MDNQHIGSRIRGIREKKKITQIALSEMAGISDRELSNIEVGKVNPRFHTIHAISCALEVSLDYLSSGLLTSEKDIYICELIEQVRNLEINEIKHIIRYVDLYSHDKGGYK